MILKQALQNRTQDYFWRPQKETREREKKKRLGFHFLKLPLLSCKNPKTALLSLAVKSKQRAAPPSLDGNRRETGPGGRARERHACGPGPALCPAPSHLRTGPCGLGSLETGQGT